MFVHRIRVVTVESIPHAAGGPGEVAITAPSQAARVIQRLIARRDRECFVVVHLGASHRVVSAEVVSVGSLSSSVVHPREVFKSAILLNAHGIICGHNHPSGDLTPSSEDHAVRRRLSEASELMGIPLVDFLIVSSSDFISTMRPNDGGADA